MMPVLRIVPSLLTLIGFAIGLAGIRKESAALLLVSLAYDVADGAIARHTGTTTDVGARLDWSVDVALSHAMAVALFPEQWPSLCAFLVALQTAALTKGWRVSGRAILTVVFVGRVFP